MDIRLHLPLSFNILYISSGRLSALKSNKVLKPNSHKESPPHRFTPFKSNKVLKLEVRILSFCNSFTPFKSNKVSANKALADIDCPQCAAHVLVRWRQGLSWSPSCQTSSPNLSLYIFSSFSALFALASAFSARSFSLSARARSASVLARSSSLPSSLPSSLAS